MVWSGAGPVEAEAEVELVVLVEVAELVEEVELVVLVVVVEEVALAALVEVVEEVALAEEVVLAALAVLPSWSYFFLRFLYHHSQQSATTRPTPSASPASATLPPALAPAPARPSPRQTFPPLVRAL